ncbi:PaaI family thioesterase [Blattabacterium cuenoti]|uniref:PaaI family thioesterase n=1 Tax=Blattabacterium cuenoti TaxID=1653831 RepID=UPI001EE9B408|nr:PaaI family thioesterase [Blattabacterium cuenoti]
MKIKFIFLSPKIDLLVAKMQINQNMLQPFGFLHGGATITLAESVGSSLSFLNLKKYRKNNYNIFNIELSVNHLKYVTKGVLIAKAKIFHKGNTIHFIRVNIFNETKSLISFCKMTNILKKICQ